MYLDLEEGRSVYLVQRLEEREFGEGKGVDAHFSMAYMGSSEFEFGALPQSLKEQRSNGMLDRKPVVIKVKQEDQVHKAYYLGPEEWLPQIRLFFQLELQGGHKVSLKEPTYIGRAYGTDPFWKHSDSREVGWWDVNNHWLLFKSKKFANKWLEGLRSK
jgi:hypothetical protein